MSMIDKFINWFRFNQDAVCWFTIGFCLHAMFAALQSGRYLSVIVALIIMRVMYRLAQARIR